MYCILLFMLIFDLVNSADSSPYNQDKIQELENRLSKLEKIVEDLEPTFAKRYGLVKRCTVPQVEHGFAQCDKTYDIKPNTKCRVVCNAGYIATAGRIETRCKNGGEWSVELKCEVPLVVIGGGEISDSSGDRSFEVIDFEGRPECNISIPDMRSQRTFHNILYHPNGPEILACNGLTSSGAATCDRWDLTGTNLTWTLQGNPHKGTYLEEMYTQLNSGSHYQNYEDPNPHKRYGRYAAESLTVDSRPVILGGMVNKEDSHQVTDTARVYDGSDWSSCKLGTKRAFFCAVKLQESLIVNLGGLGRDQNVLRTVSLRKCKGRHYLPPIKVRDIPDIPSPISGHGCTILPDSYDIIVAGGSRNQRDNSRMDSYVYSWENNSWNRTASMSTARFGHKLVTVGQNVFAIGGKQRNLDVYLDSIEVFDKEKREWSNFSHSLKKPRAHFGLALIPRSGFPGCN